MNLEQLKQKGAFVSLAPVAKEIVWKHKDPETGEEMEDTLTIHVRRLSAGAIEVMREGLKKVEGEGGSRNAAMVAHFVCLGEDGKESLTYDQAFSLVESLSNAMLLALIEVNRLGGDPKN